MNDAIHNEATSQTETQAAWEMITELELFAAKVKLVGAMILLAFLALVYLMGAPT